MISRLFLFVILALALALAGFFALPLPPEPGEREPITRARILVDIPPNLPEEARLLSLLGIRLPGSQPRPVVGTVFSSVTSTGFASSPYQTDASPCRTAAGNYVRPGTVASNFLPLGTILEIKIDGRALPGVFIVEDRMAKRFDSRIDIWFAQTSQALDFGKRSIEITVVGHGKPGQTLTIEPPVAESPAAEEPPIWDDVRRRLAFIARLITTRGTDVNRFDVDCLRLQQEELDI